MIIAALLRYGGQLIKHSLLRTVTYTRSELGIDKKKKKSPTTNTMFVSVIQSENRQTQAYPCGVERWIISPEQDIFWRKAFRTSFAGWLLTIFFCLVFFKHDICTLFTLSHKQTTLIITASLLFWCTEKLSPSLLHCTFAWLIADNRPPSRSTER